MDSRDKELLQKTFELSEENNRMLKKMLSIARWSRVARIIYWIIIVGASVGAYYYLQPYLESLLKVYMGLGDSIENIQKVFKP